MCGRATQLCVAEDIFTTEFTKFFSPQRVAWTLTYDREETQRTQRVAWVA